MGSALDYYYPIEPDTRIIHIYGPGLQERARCGKVVSTVVSGFGLSFAPEHTVCETCFKDREPPL